MADLTGHERRIIQTLRQDAKDVKDCFTQFSFQAIAFSALILGAIAGYQATNPYLALAAIAVIFLLVTIARIGNYKYGSANRQFGYELHLFRTRRLSDSTGDGWKASMRQIGWEEAMRAWRIVQATVFNHLYYTKALQPNRLRKKYRNEKYMWFNPGNLADPNATYYAGSYLNMMHMILHTFAILATIPLFFMAYQLSHLFEGKFVLSTYLIPISLLGYISFRIIKERARRKILESGLLSIHSCAIMWQAVVVAHYRALRAAENDHYVGFQHYTEYLAKQAKDLADHIFQIHQWVTDSGQSNQLTELREKPTGVA